MPDEKPKPSKAQVFRARLTSTLILWAVVTAVFVSQNAWAFFGLVVLLSYTGTAEFRSLFSKFPGKGCRFIGENLGNVVVIATGILLIQSDSAGSKFALEMTGLVLTVIGCFCWRFRVGIVGRESVNSVTDGVLAYVYVPILFGCFTLRLLFLPDLEGAVPGAWLVLFMIAAAKFTDMGAYITGSLIGKHKMAPHLSPAKTWEGFAGALAFAQLAAWIVWLLAGDQLSWIPPLHVFILALLIGLVAVAGDLAESILKRSLEVKDSGNLLPGIGGILDLIDSLCFAAPVAFLYIVFTGLA